MLNWDKTILVVAHLDDEVLWFSSIADKVAAVVVCFLGNRSHPEWGPGRRRSLQAYPIEKISCLGVDETQAFDSADWLSPVLSNHGIEMPYRPQATAGYQSAYETIESKLSEILSGYANVVTHNPWGEYGHEEHVLVYRVIDSLKSKLGYRVWFDNYFSDRSVHLMQQVFTGLDETFVEMECNAALGMQAKALLIQNNCWTWYDDWRWYPREALLSWSHEAATKSRWSPYPPLNPIHIHLRFRKPKVRRTLIQRFRSKIKGLLGQGDR